MTNEKLKRSSLRQKLISYGQQRTAITFHDTKKSLDGKTIEQLGNVKQTLQSVGLVCSRYGDSSKRTNVFNLLADSIEAIGNDEIKKAAANLALILVRTGEKQAYQQLCGYINLMLKNGTLVTVDIKKEL